jgi:hypothetical protein
MELWAPGLPKNILTSALDLVRNRRLPWVPPMPSLAETLDPETPAQPRRCPHASRSGYRCDREVMDGEEVCVLHGASIVRTREHIMRRLLALQEKSLVALEELFDFADDRTRLAAIVAVFDRTGFGPKSTLAIEESEQDVTSMTLDELAEHSDRLGHRARELKRMHEDSASLSDDDSDNPVSPNVH